MAVGVGENDGGGASMVVGRMAGRAPSGSDGLIGMQVTDCRIDGVHGVHQILFSGSLMDSLDSINYFAYVFWTPWSGLPGLHGVHWR